jgi:biotin synthase
MEKVRNDWHLNEVQELYRCPLFELLIKAGETHKEFHDPVEMQVCTLISVKTGGCPEDCKYCAQSSRYQTSTKAETMKTFEEVKKTAALALSQGVTRICLGAAWRRVRDGAAFDLILQMVTELSQMGVEVCCTLGTIGEPQARKLKEAGVYAYNHNIDSSRAYYPQFVTTRTFDERLQTLEVVRKTKTEISVCCGGIIGLGESEDDRISFLHTLCTQPSHPESVPINQLHPVPGTPYEHQKQIDFWDVLRTIATARILMPRAIVRLSAGRIKLSWEQQALCFLAGANSLWFGEKLLTVPNPAVDRDEAMFSLFGFKKRPAFKRASDAH